MNPEDQAFDLINAGLKAITEQLQRVNKALELLVETLNEREGKTMKSGLHSHYCPKCKANKYCPQFTHCKRPDTTPCLNCRAAEFVLEKTEEVYYETGKWPKE